MAVSTNLKSCFRKKKKISFHEDIIIISALSSSSSSSHPSLSFENILETFPEFLLYALPFIANRTVWNAVTSSCKTIYKQSKEKAYLPPWPFNFKLHVPGYDIDDGPSWSSDYTQIACIVNPVRIVNDDGNDEYNYDSTTSCRIAIFDQRRGILRLHRHGDDPFVDDDDDDADDVIESNKNRKMDWSPGSGYSHYHSLKFSPDGSFLVTVSNCDVSEHDGFVRLWDYNSTEGYYRQLQEWNIGGEEDDFVESTYEKYDISPCSRYFVLFYGQRVLLKDVQNNGKTIKSLLLPNNNEFMVRVRFSKCRDGRPSIFIHSFDNENKKDFIKIWRPYCTCTTASLITILEQSKVDCSIDSFRLSHDNSMFLIIKRHRKNTTVMLYSIDNVGKSTTKIKATLKHSFPASRHHSTTVRFSLNDRYISYANQDGLLAFWDIPTGREITDEWKESPASFSTSNLNILYEHQQQQQQQQRRNNN